MPYYDRPWGKSWIIRPHYRPVGLPARRDGGEPKPPMNGGFCENPDRSMRGDI